MKKAFVLFALCLLLCGCGKQRIWETVSDRIVEIDRGEPQEICLALPNGASRSALSGENGDTVYFCDGYTISVASREGGDMDATLEWLTGYPRRELTVVETKEEYCDRYYCAWASMGEQGQQIGRAVILDDGRYHYTVSVLSEDENAGDYSDAWSELLSTVSLGVYSEATS